MSDNTQGLLKQKLAGLITEYSNDLYDGMVTGEWIASQVLDEARADFEELLTVRTFHLKYGPANLAEWDKNTLRELDALYQVKTIEKIKKWFGIGAP